MAQRKSFTAKKTLRLDCGHTVKSGEAFTVIRSFVCPNCSKPNEAEELKAEFASLKAKLEKHGLTLEDVNR